MKRGPRAFTVLEILVATTITVGLAGIVIAVTTGALGVWRRSQAGLTSNTQVKVVFDFLERDLRAVVDPNGAEARLAADIINAPETLTSHGWNTTGSMFKPAGEESRSYLTTAVNESERRISRARFGLSGVWLRLVTTNVESSGSMPVAVAYQVVRRPVTGAPGNAADLPVRYTLFRSAVGTDDTLAAGYAVTASTYQAEKNTPAATRTATTLTNPNNADALCANVVDFGLWLYRRQTDGNLLRVFPTSPTDGEFRARGDDGTGAAATYPDIADVMIRILSEDGAVQLEKMERGLISQPDGYATPADWWWAVVEANSSVYVARFAIEEGAR